MRAETTIGQKTASFLRSLGGQLSSARRPRALRGQRANKSRFIFYRNHLPELSNCSRQYSATKQTSPPILRLGFLPDGFLYPSGKVWGHHDVFGIMPQHFL